MAESEIHPPIDPEVDAVFKAFLASQGKESSSLRSEDIPRLRAELLKIVPNEDFLRHGGTVEVEETLIPGPNGAPEIPTLILRPASGSGPFPCIFYTCNGGKIVRGNRIAITDVDLDWIVDFGVVWVSVAPRVGPEDPHPAQVEDCYAGLVWTKEHAAELEIDPDRIMVLGKSGGGGIAAATALYARDHGGPHLSHQILIYPMLDDREATVSSKFEGVFWDRTSNKTGWTAMLGEAAGGPNVDPYAAPSRAMDLTGLPPAYLEVGGTEVFRDETIDYAARLGEAGVPVELHVWVGALHGHELSAPQAEVSQATVAARTSYMRRALAR